MVKKMAILGFTKELYFTTSTVIDWMARSVGFAIRLSRV